jgi:hypothetical protein
MCPWGFKTANACNTDRATRNFEGVIDVKCIDLHGAVSVYHVSLGFTSSPPNPQRFCGTARGRLPTPRCSPRPSMGRARGRPERSGSRNDDFLVESFKIGRLSDFSRLSSTSQKISRLALCSYPILSSSPLYHDWSKFTATSHPFKSRRGTTSTGRRRVLVA